MVIKMKEFDELYELVKYLRSENGCPWDRQQTSKTIAFDLVEEAYEVNDAIEKNEVEKLKEELGDLLFLILMHVCIEEEKGAFTLNDVIESVRNKMILRHPHVFRQKTFETLSELLENWERSKTNPLETIPDFLPALLMGQKLVQKLQRLNKDATCENLLDQYINKNDIPPELYEALRILTKYTCKGRNLEKDLRSLILKLKNEIVKNYNEPMEQK